MKQNKSQPKPIRKVVLKDCDIFLKGDWLYEEAKGSVPARRFAYASEVTDSLVDMDTGKVLLEISFLTVGGKMTILIPRGDLMPNKLVGYLDVGMDVGKHVVDRVARFLLAQEKELTPSHSHDTLGFTEYDGKLVYRLQNAVGIRSTYTGDFDLEPKGDLKGWQQVIETEVLGTPNLELALALGLAAPVTSFIASFTNLDVILFHLVSDSTKGKTTAGMLAVSAFGNPMPGKRGLLLNWDGSNVAVTGPFRNVHGVPMVLDEASLHDSKSFTKQIYRLANGVDKSRLDQSGGTTATATWSGAILSTAEHSLLDMSNQNIGLRVRLFEIANREWTRSAANAKALQAGLLQNHGVAGLAFVRYLMKQGPEKVAELWSEWSAKLNESGTGKDPFSERVADKLALVAVAAQLAQESIVPGLNVQTIVDCLAEIANESGQNRDLAKSAYDWFWQCVTQHYQKFVDGPNVPNNECWGKIDRQPGKTMREVYVLPKIFRELLFEGGFQDSKVILQEWKRRQWLDAEKGKMTREKVITPRTPGQDVLVVRNVCDPPKEVEKRRISKKVSKALFDELD